MKKLNMQTADLIAEKVQKLLELFPECRTELTDAGGQPQAGIDFERLQQQLSRVLPVGAGATERYSFNWPDKAKAAQLANAPIRMALRPCREESLNFDSTRNLYIEGENLDVLKCLRETYLGRVQMIYIDPPYNTGGDFIYEDDFSQSAEEYRGHSGDYDAAGNRLVLNLSSNGRFHTDWLNMIYPRLKVARDLLAEDGVMFISIDDNEQANLRKVCDEVFGESAFVTTIHCQMSTTQGMKVKAAKNGNIVKNSEYILCYCKSGKSNIARNILYDPRPEYDAHYTLYLKDNGEIGNICELYDYRHPADCAAPKPLKLAEAYRKSKEFADAVRLNVQRIVRSDKVTGFADVDGLETGRYQCVERDGREYVLTRDKNGKIVQLMRLSDSWGKTDGYYGQEGLRKIRGDWWEGFYIDMGNVAKEGRVVFRNGKKPVRLIKQLAYMVTQPDDLVLDFFSGSATTAHAVMALNAEDAGTRRFIMVQTPAPCKLEEGTADAEGPAETICDRGKARLRNAGEDLVAEAGGELPGVDIGFRVLKLDSTNMKDVYYRPEDLNQKDLFDMVDHVKPGRSAEDILFQVMLQLNIMLDAGIDKQVWDGTEVYRVTRAGETECCLLACFSSEMTEALAQRMAAAQPQYALVRDCGENADSLLSNIECLFRRESPMTELIVL